MPLALRTSLVRVLLLARQEANSFIGFGPIRFRSPAFQDTYKHTYKEAYEKIRFRYPALRPTPYALRPTPYTLRPTPYALRPTPYTLHLTPYTLNQEAALERQTSGSENRGGGSETDRSETRGGVARRMCSQARALLLVATLRCLLSSLFMYVCL